MFLSKPRWNPDGKHIYITGGSSGLGLALAELLVTEGAHVSIVARNQQRLDAALGKMEAARIRPTQELRAYSYALDTSEGSNAALEAVCGPFNGDAPDAIFACAGACKPMFFVEMTEEDMTKGMDDGYWVQAWTAWAATKKYVQHRKKGAKIVMVASVLSYFSLLGWTSYAPGKHALRGLADTLHSELQLYGIDVHIYYPNTIFSPGYEEECKTKPELSQQLEGTVEGFTPEQCAKILLKGVAKGHFDIVNDFFGNVFRSSCRGGTPRRSYFVEGFMDLFAFIVVPLWRNDVDKKIRGHRTKHERYLQERGFFAEAK